MTEICVLMKTTFEEIKERLIQEGFKHTETYNNHDIYFTTLSQNLNTIPYPLLLEKSILIREVNSETSSKKYIIYKKKSFDKNGNVIDEIKTKLKIDNIENAESIFKNLGFLRWCNYVVNNNEFKKGEIIINVQNVKELGIFIEIEEFESIKEKPEKEKFNILKEIVLSLNLNTSCDYSCKKPFMMLNKTYEDGGVF